MTTKYVNVVERDDSTSPCTVSSELVQVSAVSPNPNLVINGDMRVAQRGTSFTAPSNGEVTLDRWRQSAGGIYDVTQDTDVPAGVGFLNSLKIDVTTAKTTVGAGDVAAFLTRIEGFDWSVLEYGTSSARTCTLSFWLKSDTKTGTFCVSLRNDDQNVSYVANVTVPDNLWNQYVLTIPGEDSGTYTWLTDNGTGCTVTLTFMAGTNLQIAGSPETWVGESNKFATSSIDNFMDSTSNNIWFTGVKLEVGDAVTPFVSRSFGEELALCQRYWQQSYLSGTVAGTATTTNIIVTYAQAASNAVTQCIPLDFKVSMRKAPVVEFYSSSGASGNLRNNSTSSDVSAGPLGQSTHRVTMVTLAAGVSANNQLFVHFTADAEL